MNIIDVHMHLGDCRMCELDNHEDEIIEAMKKNEISASILQNFPYIRDNYKGHELISNISKKYPGKIYGIISANPHCDDEYYYNYIKKIYKLGGFVGIKLHTLGYCVSPLSKDADKVYKIAKEYNLAVMIHTGLTNFGESALALVPAKKYPDVDFVLAHSGWSGHASQAIVAALNSENIYLETSWTSIDDKSAIISNIGSSRVMFGSDTISNIPIEIEQYKRLCIPDKDLENILFRVAKKVFKI